MPISSLPKINLYELKLSRSAAFLPSGICRRQLLLREFYRPFCIDSSKGSTPAEKLVAAWSSGPQNLEQLSSTRSQWFQFDVTSTQF
ncbi:hypothetical protein RRG08_037808 [Elysia crispata]|uniref:Uncharacterized protein n=1 Tax=Elysia crispata TaxID=231223 RepID=A0AAE1BCB3_9GAST|nr:hypothetical protein RRG08_037808 [Elysia crispata]